MTLTIASATPSDISDILSLLEANRDDASLFQQPRWEVQRGLAEFMVARGPQGRPLGCIQVHAHRSGPVEILAVAVHPDGQGQGVGTAMMEAAVRRARGLASAGATIFLSTRKPGYFARHGFVGMSRWRLPLSLLVAKLPKVFRQPVPRWLPAIFGRHVFMALA